MKRRLAAVKPLNRRSRFEALAVLLVSLALAACGDDSPPRPVTPAAQSADVAGLWMGSYHSTTGDSGTAVLDLKQENATLEGDVVFRRWGSSNNELAGFLKGSVQGDQITIRADGDTLSLPYEFHLEAALPDSNHLEGRFSHSMAGVTADFRLERQPRGEISVESSVGLEYAVSAMAFNGDSLWLATVEADYLVGKPGSGTLHRVRVYMPDYDAYWVATALASDGNVLWGPYPVNDKSDLIQFTRQGVIERRFSISHRTSGLAWDGEALWSLGPKAILYRLNESGEVTDSLETGCPDLYMLEYAGGHFWSVGWFIRKLYKINRSGRVVAVYDLPRGPGWDLPTGLASDGSKMYYASIDVPSYTTFYTLKLGSVGPLGGTPWH